jgi:hypothetical protein
MTAPRRRIVRPPSPSHRNTTQRRLDRLRESLKREQAALKRWQKRFKRAYTAIHKHQAAVIRIERQLAQLPNP